MSLNIVVYCGCVSQTDRDTILPRNKSVQPSGLLILYILHKLKQTTPGQQGLVVFFTRLLLLAAFLTVLFPLLVFTLLLFTFPRFLFFRPGEEVEGETEEDWKTGTTTDQHGVLLQVVHA